MSNNSSAPHKAGIKAALAAATLLVSVFARSPARAETLAAEFGIKQALYETALAPLKLEQARRDPNAFIEFCATNQGRPVRQAGFHRDIQKLIGFESKSAVIAIPRGHGKTSQVAWRVVWELGRNPEIRVKIVGAVDDKAEEILGLVRQILEENEKVRMVFPRLAITRSAKDQLWVARKDQQRDPSVQASGVTGAGAGGRADLLVFDDVVDASNALANPAFRSKVKEAIYEVWIPLISNNGKFVWICTPYHIDDASHELRQKALVDEIFELYWRPVIEYEDVLDPVTGEVVERIEHILWPEEWPKEKLEIKRRSIGERAYSRQYMLNALSDDERTYPDDTLRRSGEPDLESIGYYLDPEGYVKKIPDDWPTFAGGDLASTLGKKSAYTVILTLALDPDEEKVYIKDIVRRKMGMESTISVILDQYTLHNWVSFYVENNNYQRAVAESSELHKKYVPVQGVHTGINKHHEEIGLRGLAVAFDQGLFVLPFAKFPYSESDDSTTAQLMWELQTHPGGKFTDIIMALWFAFTAYKASLGDFEDAYIASVGM